MANKEEFLTRLRATFRAEAGSRAEKLSALLLELEHAPSPAERAPLLETTFREVHSFKGAARSVDRTDLESICQAFESVLAAARRDAVAFTAQRLDTLHRVVDALRSAVESDAILSQERVSELVEQLAADGGNAAAGPPDRPTTAPPAAGSALEQRHSTDDGEAAPPPAEPARAASHATETGAITPLPPPGTDAARRAAPGPVGAETVRVTAARLDTVMRQVEGMLAAKLSAAQCAADLRDARDELTRWKAPWAKVSVETQYRTQRGPGPHAPRAGAVPRKLLEYLDWHQPYLQALETRLTAMAATAEHDRRAISGMVDTLLDDMKQVLLMPFATVLELFPKMVRDLSRGFGKQVELVLHGGEVEIDRRILEEIKDPLIHLVRNVIDHGIETPAERLARQKPACGTLTIVVAQVEGNRVEIRVGDDGAGIDATAVKRAAVRRGVVRPEEVDPLDESAAIALIFRSEVSTSALITDLSGRGLGLAIVREKVERLGGSVAVENRPGAGVTFRLLLPLTLATFKGVFVRTAGRDFVFPTASIERLLRIRPDLVSTVENRDTVSFDGHTVPLLRLEDVLGLPHKANGAGAATFGAAIVLRAGDQHVAFQVDAVLGEQDVLVKGLGRQLVRVRNVAGATILGSGAVVPILHVPDLIKSASAAAAPCRAAAVETERKQPSILVVEDSITSRMLLVNILESAGYRVQPTVDGIEAWTALRSEEYDAVVSDIEMPRMDGFELTTRIRADAKLAKMPVVLVTARDARADRERGIDVGANAYIVKSSFDQSNLLDIVRRLV